MTPVEVYREIDKDIDNVARWWLGKRKKLTDIAKWTIKLPRKTWFDYESPRKNKYIVLSIIMGRKYNNESMTCVAALQKMDRGYAVYGTRFPWQYNADRLVYLPHVFDRYHDRGNVQKTGIDLIKHFLERNIHGDTSLGDQFAGRSVRYKGRDNMALSVNDGVLLGEDVEDIFVAHTFITYDMATEIQREEFESRRKNVMNEKEILDAISKIRRDKYKEMREELIAEYMSKPATDF